MKKRGFATYLSWSLKILSALWSLFAGWCSLMKGDLNVQAIGILTIAGAIVAPALPIDASKYKVAGKPDIKEFQ